MVDFRNEITVHKRLRPLRLAFLVRLGDREGLVRVLEANTCLWGGMYNGIIPCFNKTPRWWTDGPLEKPSARDIIHGYLDAFEPDFVVYTDPTLRSRVDLPDWQVISLDEVMKGDEDREIQYGLPVTKYYRHLFKEEFKFQRSRRIPVFLPKGGNKDRPDAFIAAVFGIFPSQKPFSSYRNQFQELFEPAELEVTCENLLRLQDGLFPLNVGSFRLERLPRGWSNDRTLFLMDPSRPQDVVDYWNLQALGWEIQAVPVRWSVELAEALKLRAQEIHRPSKQNPNIWYSTNILKSRSVSEDVLKSFCSMLYFPSPKEGHGAFSIQSRYPRIWDEWAREHDGSVRPEVHWEAQRESVFASNRRISFSRVSPDFVTDYGFGSTPRWANVLNFHHFSGTGEFSTCFPEDIGDCDSLFRDAGLQKTSVTSEGITVRCAHPRELVHCELPSPESLVQTWLRNRKIKMRVSSAGSTARELVRMIGGPSAANLFNREGIVRLFDRMAMGMVEDDTDDSIRRRPKGRAVSAGELFGILQKAHAKRPSTAESHLHALLREKIIRVGILIECSKCGQRNWYALDDLQDNLKCERCLQPFPFPAAHPGKECLWSYRVQGPFATEGFARGAYTVTLLLRLLLDHFNCDINTWLPGVEIAWGEVQVEADLLGFFGCEPQFGHRHVWMFLAECKSFGNFEKKDFDRAKKMMERFPGAVFCFAALKANFEGAEKRAMAKLALWGRKTIAKERWRNPVIVLTGRELFCEMSLHQTWKDAGGELAHLIDYYQGDNEVQWFAEATQMAYLDLPPWHHQIKDKIRRKKEAQTERPRRGDVE